MPNLLPFDNRWKKYFAKEKELLSKALVGQKINSIEHIGATSVVMCGTYGTIDLLLAIPSYLDFLTIKNLLDKKGYEFIQRGSLLEELFFVRRNEKKQIVATIRLVEYASQKYKEYETFKIYLKANPNNVKKYNEFRQQLLNVCDGEVKRYQEVKANYIEAVLKENCEIR